MRSYSPTPTESRDTKSGQLDLPYELIGHKFALPNGAKGRVIGFSRLYESEVIVGIISGDQVLRMPQAPKTRMLVLNGKVKGSMIDQPKPVDGGVECHYETYSQIMPRATAPLRRDLMAAGVDIPALRARMKMLYTQPRLNPDATSSQL